MCSNIVKNHCNVLSGFNNNDNDTDIPCTFSLIIRPGRSINIIPADVLFRNVTKQ